MKKTLVVIFILCAGLLAWSFVMWSWVMPVTAVPLLTATPSLTPTITPTTLPTFWATAEVTTSDTVVAIGEEVSVTTNLTIAPGCVFPLMELALTQQGEDAPIFAPESVILGPPIAMPHTITFTAVTAGTIRFRSALFGERNCGDYWNWWWVGDLSDPVTVQLAPTGNLPDLIISDITYNGGTPQCGTHPPDLGARVWVANIGNAPAGSFVVEVNNTWQQTVEELAAGEQLSLVFGGALGPVTAVADATNLLEESDESNNSFSTILPVPTQPPPCTPTPTPAYQQFLPVTTK